MVLREPLDFQVVPISRAIDMILTKTVSTSKSLEKEDRRRLGVPERYPKAGGTARARVCATAD